MSVAVVPDTNLDNPGTRKIKPRLFGHRNLDNSNKTAAKFLVVTGKSGGHVFPALVFLDTVLSRCKDTRALLVLPQGAAQSQLNKGAHNYGVKYISISAIKLSLDFKNIVAILKFFKGIWQSLFIFLKFQPDMVVGFGSLACLPLVVIARLCRTKVLIHEQNVIPGKANRFLAKFSNKIAISFVETKDYLKWCNREIVVTGNPLRPELKKCDRNKAMDFFGFNPDRFTILVTGGSAGSHSINMSFVKALSLLPESSRLQIIHLCGDRDYDLLQKGYKDIGSSLKLYTFLDDMQYAYTASDLAITRAGATTIAELVFFGVAAIIVPYPFAYQHQLANAQVLSGRGCAVVIQDNQLDTLLLKETLGDFIRHPDKIKAMRENYRQIPRYDADNLLVDAALSLN